MSTATLLHLTNQDTVKIEKKNMKTDLFLILVTYISLPLNKLKTLYKFKSPLTQTSLCLFNIVIKYT